MSNKDGKDKLDLRESIKAKGFPGAIKHFIENSQLWRSFFRHGLEDTPKTRMQTIISNVFLHLHPAKVKRHAPLFKFTWCMGGITFFTFLVLTITGVFPDVLLSS